MIFLLLSIYNYVNMLTGGAIQYMWPTFLIRYNVAYVSNLVESHA